MLRKDKRLAGYGGCEGGLLGAHEVLPVEVLHGVLGIAGAFELDETEA